MVNNEISEAMLARTPKAVRTHLEALERQNARLLDSLQVAQGVAPPGCNTWVGGSVRNDHVDTPIGRNSRIVFDTAEGRVEAYVDQDGVLCVRGQWSILVSPQSGNVINIRPGQFPRD